MSDRGDDDFFYRYDNVVGKIKPPPKYYLMRNSQIAENKESGIPRDPLTPETIQKFKHIRISEFYMRAVSSGRSISEYVDALNINDQNPRLSFPCSTNKRLISLSELSLVFQFQVLELNASWLCIGEGEEMDLSKS